LSVSGDDDGVVVAVDDDDEDDDGARSIRVVAFDAGEADTEYAKIPARLVRVLRDGVDRRREDSMTPKN
jgi:hypothetical protein